MTNPAPRPSSSRLTSIAAPPSTAPNTAPVESGPDRTLEEHAAAAESHLGGVEAPVLLSSVTGAALAKATAPATYEGPSRARSRRAPFDPPPSPRLLPEHPEHTPAAREAIRAENRARIASYNTQYAGYLETYVAGVQSAPSLERARALGAPLGYDPTSSLPAAQRAMYDDALAAPMTQNAVSAYRAIELKRLEAAGERVPMSVGLTVGVSGEVGMLRGAIGYDGRKPGGLVTASAGAGADAKTLRGHFADAPPPPPSGYVRTSDELARANEQKRREAFGTPNATFDVRFDADGNPLGKVGVSLGSGLGVLVKREPTGYAVNLDVVFVELEADEAGLKSVALDLKLAKVSWANGTLTTSSGVAHQTSILGARGTLVATTSAACDGVSMEVGGTAGGGIDSVLSARVSGSAHVQGVKAAWVEHAIGDNGFFR